MPQGNLLQDIVSSYVGALIQREHIKNKRLDDIMTTAGNAQQAQLQRLNDRLGENLHKVLDDAPTSNYGPAPRQLGVTPYPAPPNTTEVSVPVGNDDDEDDEPPKQDKPPVADKGDDQPNGNGESKSGMSPLTAGLLGAALTMAGAGGGMALSSYFSSESTPITIEQPPTVINDAAGGGAVDILVR